jgi:hypothetical protein
MTLAIFGKIISGFHKNKMRKIASNFTRIASQSFYPKCTQGNKAIRIWGKNMKN